MKKQQKTLINICVWSAIILFAIRCVLAFESLKASRSLYELFGYASESISISLIFTIVYEKVLWRFNPIEKTPKLSKKYVGILKSDHDNIEREATLIVRQTLSSIHVTMITGESKSKSLTASIDEVLGEMQLTYCYLNTPKSEFRHRSEIHYGTAMIAISDPQKIEGQYYTDRKTNGDMRFEALNS